MRARAARRIILVLLSLSLLAGCLLPAVPTPAPTGPAAPTASVEAPSPTPVAPTVEALLSPTVVVAELTATASPPTPSELVILHTNDEHGYLLPEVQGGFASGGAGHAEANWLAKGWDPRDADSAVLLLSGGDSLTGEAISTWFEGESTIEVMNALGYAASAVGNHEFDFGQEALRARAAQARFPYLAANIYRQDTDQVAEPFEPYTLIDVAGVQVGIVGLALESTPRVTAIKNLEGLTFGPYEPALRRWVPVMRQEGAQVVVALTHICPRDLVALAGRTKDLGVDLFLGGHCHQSATSSMGGAPTAASSAHWKDYVITRVELEPATGQPHAVRQQLVDVLYPENKAPTLTPETAALLTKWEERTELVLGEVIGYTATGLGQHSTRMHNLLVDSWLWAYPGDVAISNLGGFRDGIPRGEITIRELVAVFPFPNEILELELRGDQLTEAVRRTAADMVIGGVSLEPTGALRLDDGTPVDPEATYSVLVNDYVYYNNKYPFQRYDPEPYETSIHWRQPVIDWIRAQHSDASSPLEQRISPEARRISLKAVALRAVPAVERVTLSLSVLASRFPESRGPVVEWRECLWPSHAWGQADSLRCQE